MGFSIFTFSSQQILAVMDMKRMRDGLDADDDDLEKDVAPDMSQSTSGGTNIEGICWGHQ